MPADARIAEVIEKALAAGIPHESLVGVLTARGWPEKEVYDALADHYQRLTGIDIPRRSGAGASAKDAFFYLLIFSTLATWTIGLGTLAFTLIDRWLADPLFTGYQQTFDTYIITSSLAAVIVAFPLYLLISRTVLGEAAAHPEKLDSSIRKWLTYMALVIAACVFMGDLITALAYLLRGELTSRFLAKAFVVLALSGGVFFYYFGGLRKTELTPARLNRDRLMAGLSSAFVVLMVIIGFFNLGTPSSQRELRADAQRVQQLYQLSSGGQELLVFARIATAARHRSDYPPMAQWLIPSPARFTNTTLSREANTSSARPSRGAATTGPALPSRTHGPIPPDTTVFSSTQRV